MTTRPPPNNQKAERAVLGALMIASSQSEAVIIDRVQSILHPDAFYKTAHRLIYEAILDLHGKRVTPDLVSLHDCFLNDGRLKDIGGLDYLNSLIDATVTTARVEQNAAIVKRHALSRQALEIAQRTIEGISTGEADAVQAATEMERVSREIVAASGARDPQAEYERWQTRFTRQRTGSPTFVSTTYPGLDRVLAIGFGPGISVWAGRTGAGKTTTLLNIARRLAAAGQRVLLFPNETGCDKALDMMACAAARIPHVHLLKSPHLVKDEHQYAAQEAAWQIISNVVTRPPPSPKYEKRYGDRNAPMIDAYAAEIVAADCPIVMIELFQMGFASLEPNDIVTALYGLRKFVEAQNRYHVAIFHHVSQKDEKGKENKKPPKMKDIRASQGYAESADLVIGIHRPTEPERERDTIEYSVLKQRDGSPAGPIVQFSFNGPLRLIEGDGERIDGLMVSREEEPKTTGEAV